MSYEDMARSHVKELAREAFQLSEVVVDPDGDLPFPCGTAMFYVSVVRDGRFVRVWSQAVAGIEVGKRVLREVNEANSALVFARVYATPYGVWVEGCLPVESLRADDLGRLHGRSARRPTGWARCSPRCTAAPSCSPTDATARTSARSDGRRRRQRVVGCSRVDSSHALLTSGSWLNACGKLPTWR